MMRSTIVLFLMPVLLLGSIVCAADDKDKKEERPGRKTVQTAPPGRPMSRPRASRPARVRQPVVIQMNRPGNGSVNHPAQQPSYGQVQRRQTARPQQDSAPSPAFNRQAVRKQGAVPAPAARSAVAVHHHVYTQGYVRKKLVKIGVKTEPRFITDRSEIVSSDRAHSVIGNPRTGPKGETFKGSLVSPRKFNSAVVRNQMSVANRPAFIQQIDRENRTEMERNHMYWHGGAGFDYSYTHFIDNSGYHWYGWYRGDQFFWTRNYNGRWWWYDTGYNRWCFYNDNYWWWQDPNHVGELYVYDDDSYIPANSADDPVVVSGPEQNSDTAYSSPDGARLVKIEQGDGDAFLYDRSDPPAFDPVYLASGVQSVQFSNTSNGRPLEIILKLNDGSFDMFDGEGRVYNSETSDGNQ